MEVAQARQRSIKVIWNENTIRRISLDLSPESLTYSSLCQIIQKLFSLGNCHLKVTWIDDEGDVISISSDAELNEAVTIMGKLSLTGSLKFGVTTSDNAAPEQYPIDVLHQTTEDPLSRYRCHYCKKVIPEGIWYQIISEDSQISCCRCEELFKLSQQSLSIKMYNSNHHSLVEKYLKGFSHTRTAGSVEPHREKLWKFVPKRTNESDSTTDWRKPQSTASSSASSSNDISSPHQSPSGRSKPMCRFIRDVSYLDGEKVAPSTEFKKTWRVKNDGNRPWPGGCQLAPAGGDHFQIGENTQLPSIEASEEVDLTVTLLSPPVPGRYVSYYRPQTSEGKWFGQRLWADIRVASSELPPATVPSPVPESNPTEIPDPPWQHELSILSTMGFTDRDDCIARLEKFSATPRLGFLLGSQTPPSSTEILQQTIFDLLRR
jgi:hypothetical protein